MFPFRCITVLPYFHSYLLTTPYKPSSDLNETCKFKQKKGLMATSVLTLDQKK